MMSDIPEGVKYRVAYVVDVFADQADDPLSAAKEADDNIQAGYMNGYLPVLEVTEVATGIVTLVDLQDHYREGEDG
jgi:hypothetical protein